MFLTMLFLVGMPPIVQENHSQEFLLDLENSDWIHISIINNSPTRIACLMLSYKTETGFCEIKRKTRPEEGAQEYFNIPRKSNVLIKELAIIDEQDRRCVLLSDQKMDFSKNIFLIFTKNRNVRFAIVVPRK